MSPISEWLRDNWFDLGSLAAQCAIALILAWYGRKALSILSATSAQSYQAEASAGLSLLNATAPRLATEKAQPSRSEASPAPIKYRARIGIVDWLRAPMGSSSVGPWLRMVRWFQAPMGS
jgi:hypothetical protein